MSGVSIIIINHNYSAFLRACIESCLSQDLPPAEIIVVDDGSSDRSREIIEGFVGLVKIVLNDQQGHVASLNSGFFHSTGDICIFLDADDFLYPQCTKLILSRWRQSLSKIQYRLDTVDQLGVDQGMTFPYFPDNLTPSEVKRQASSFGVYPWTVSTGNAYCRQYLQSILPIDNKIIYRSPDGYLNKLAPLYGDILSLRDVLGAYRVHGSNAWAQDGKAVRVEPIIRWLKFDIVLQDAFIKHANIRRISVDNSRTIRSLQQLEYRLLAFRFAPDSTPYIADNALKLFRLGVCFLPAAPNVSVVGKFIWLLWIGAMSFSPHWLVKYVFLRGRGQAKMISLLNRLIKASRPSK